MEQPTYQDVALALSELSGNMGKLSELSAKFQKLLEAGDSLAVVQKDYRALASVVSEGLQQVSWLMQRNEQLSRLGT